MRKSDYVLPASSSAKPVNYIFPTLLTTILCISFTLMLTSTYALSVNKQMIMIVILSMAFVATSLHILTEKKKWVSRVILILSLFIPVLVVWADIGGVRRGVDALAYVLKRFTFRDWDYDVEKPHDAEGVLTGFLLVVNILPVLFTSYVIARRKSILLCIPFYVPFLFLSVALNYKFPEQLWCELAIGGIILLCLFHCLRKSDRVAGDRKLLIMTVPAMCLAFLVGIWFPQEGYDKNKLAVRSLNSIEEFFGQSKLPGNLGKVSGSGSKSEKKPYMGGIEISQEDGEISFSRVEHEYEDLNRVGNFDPPDYVLMKACRYDLLDYDMVSTYQGDLPIEPGDRALYLRNRSLDTYTGHEWGNAEEEPRSEHIYAEDAALQARVTAFALSVDTMDSMDYHYYVPCYADFYTMLGDDTGIYPGTQDFNVLLSLGESDSTINTYPFYGVPVQRSADVWSEEYLKYVNTTTLDVPEETRKQILDSGLLPEWYMALYNGEIEASVYDKVIAVSTFVNKLHPYDAHTDYPDEDKDFVVWFMEDSQTGFCVHYASTTVILLRMLGVPARYCTGYMLDNMLLSAKDYFVSTKDAHAWFEFFTPEYGWVMGDPTPGNSLVADGYDVHALIEKYGIPSSAEELMKYGEPDNPTVTPKPGNRATPTPRPTGSAGKAPDGGKTPGADGDSGNSSDSKGLKMNPIVRKILLGAGVVILILLLIRAIYTALWRRAFSRSDINARARAYYHYFSWIGRKWNRRPSSQVRTIAQKAAFSKEGITEKELEDLVSSGKHELLKARKKQHWYRKVPVQVLFEVRV